MPVVLKVELAHSRISWLAEMQVVFFRVKALLASPITVRSLQPRVRAVCLFAGLFTGWLASADWMPGQVAYQSFRVPPVALGFSKKLGTKR